jgi:hypothetical protein
MHRYSLHRRKNTLFLFASVLVLVGSFCATLLSNVAAKSNSAQTSANQSIFPPADNVLGLFEFENDVKDSSGNGRDLTLIGGSIVSSRCSSGLKIEQTAVAGVEWNAYASLIEHPYTIEMVLTPEDTLHWRKLFSFDPNLDDGWYYYQNGIQAYPHEVFGSPDVRENQLHYIAFVSTSPSTIDIYFQGQLIGSSDAAFTAPPSHAVFFQDDSAVPEENFSGIVEAMRISSVSRTPEEIAAVQERLNSTCGNNYQHQLFLPFVYS